jgi:hypothetical protein
MDYLVLPFVGGLLGISAVWLYAAEYIRSQSMSHGFRRILNAYGYYKPTELRSYQRAVLKPKIGWTTIYVLASTTLVLTILNLYMVWSNIRRR